MASASTCLSRRDEHRIEIGPPELCSEIRVRWGDGHALLPAIGVVCSRMRLKRLRGLLRVTADAALLDVVEEDIFRNAAPGRGAAECVSAAG